MDSSKHQGKLTGRCAIVTGGGSGIGRATALCLANHGAAIAVADINAEAAESVAETVNSGGGHALAIVADLGDEESISDMIRRTVSEFGGLDVLHNNAAALGPNVIGRDLGVLEMDLDTWNRTLAVNLTGPMLASKYAIPHMIERGGGSIINTASGAASHGDARMTAYGTSKGALVTLTRYIATQYGKQGVRCNAISPGLIVHATMNAGEAALKIRLEQHLTPRLGRSEDIANAVAFLASDESAFVTGQVLSVDGGYVAHSPWLNLPALRDSAPSDSPSTDGRPPD